MSPQVVEAIFTKTLRSELVGPNVEYLFHAGEPLLAGREFYLHCHRVAHANNPLKKNISLSVQTNGIGIDDDWCDVFRRINLHVGLSVDGPEFLHDRNRVGWTGKPTHRLVMKGFQTLSNHGFRVGGLIVLTRESLRYPDEIFNFFLENEFGWIAFNSEEIENSHGSTSLDRSKECEVAYKAFMSRIFDRWVADPNRIRVREFDRMLEAIKAKQSDSKFYRQPDETREHAIITISRDGFVATNSPEFCGGKSDEYGDFRFGNILNDSVEDIFKNPLRRKLYADISAGIRNCRGSCEFFDLCGGGSPSNKYFENGDLRSTKTVTCSLHKIALAEVVIEKLTAIDTTPA